MQGSDNPMWDLMKRELTLLHEYHVGQGVGDNTHTVSSMTPNMLLFILERN